MRPPGNASTGEVGNGWRSGHDHGSRDDARGSDPALDVALKAILVLGCLAMLILLAASRLLYPLEGDGALFLTAARMMDDGGVLDVDFSEVKQPGIYFFYLWAGRMFGFTFEGVHLFQLVYWAAIGALMFAFVRSYLVNRWVAILACVSADSGTSGVGVHLTTMMVLFSVFSALYVLARTIGTVTAMTWNYLLNNGPTLQDRRRTGWGLVTGWISFAIVCSVGMLGNVGIANWLYERHNAWIVSTIAGILAGVV